MLNPFRKIEEIKAEKQRAKEEKLRKRKQQQKKELVISGLFLAVCALIITIGSCNEAKTNNSINDNASIIQTTEPISAPTAEPTVVPSIAPTLTPTPVPVFSLSGIPAYGSSAYVEEPNGLDATSESLISSGFADIVKKHFTVLTFHSKNPNPRPHSYCMIIPSSGS